MGKAVKFTAPYQVGIVEYPERELAPGEVRIATLYSGISSGTELSHYRGTNPGVLKKYDPVSKLFRREEATAWYPRSSGYEEVGEVVEIGPGVEGIERPVTSSLGRGNITALISWMARRPGNANCCPASNQSRASSLKSGRSP